LIGTLVLAVTVAPAQSPNPQTLNSQNAASTDATGRLEFRFQTPQRRPGFSITPAESLAPTAKVPLVPLPVLGGGTPGRLSKWTDSTLLNSFIGDSNIFESNAGNVGIGTNTPGSPLTVAGMIETKLGGYKFPDGTIQTTAFSAGQAVSSLNGLKGDVTLAAGPNITITPSGNTLTVAAPNALTTVEHDATLTGNGTAASPLSVVQGAGDASEPFQIQLGIVGSSGETETFTVPAGKRLVIEYAGAVISRTTTPDLQPNDFVQIRTQVGPTTMNHPLVSTRTAIVPSSNFTVYFAGQVVKIYADPGTQVQGIFSGEADSALVKLSGYLVNVP
jgi:hypothetical protein